MSVYDFGDFHHNERNEIEFLSYDNFPEQESMTKDDVLIIKGDTGLLVEDFSGKYEKIRKLQDWFVDKNYTTFCIMGNHEIWSLYYKLDTIEKWGGKVKVLPTKNGGEIYFAITGEIYTISNKTFFVVNGALSPDYKQRIMGLSWFKEEDISYSDMNKVDEVASNTKYVDYLMTHTTSALVVPYFISGVVYSEKCKTSEYLAYLDTILNYGENRFGHFHITKTIVIGNKTYTSSYMASPRKLG